ncbi:transmembrane protein 187-like [Glandiceps talaboti]
MGVIIESFFHVVIPVTVLCMLVLRGMFDDAHTEVGYEYYAEQENPDWGFIKLPEWLKMPANSIVNVGYCIVGIHWLYSISKHQGRNFGNREKYMYFVFSWQAVFYGIVQYQRIATQSHRWAILDQWLTFPFFAWVTVWGSYITEGWNTRKTVVTMSLSVVIYLLNLLHPRGFDLALGVLIISAVLSVVRVHQKHNVKDNIFVFLYAVLSCAGFVGLKLSDHYLAQYKIFQYLTGHFWSKVCDILQIHFVCRFFYNVDTQKQSIHKTE